MLFSYCLYRIPFDLRNMTQKEQIHIISVQVPGFIYNAEGTGSTLEQARSNALDRFDALVDRNYGVSHGLNSYEKGKEIKDKATQLVYGNSEKSSDQK